MAADDPVVSGRYACARKYDGSAETELYEITGWTMSETSEDVTYASCETDGQRKRVDGAYDITGTLTGVVNTLHPLRSDVSVGDNLVLHLFIRKPSVGVTGIYHKIPVKVLGIDGGANVEEAGPQRWTLNWGYNVTDTDPVALFDQTAAALAS